MRFPISSAYLLETVLMFAQYMWTTSSQPHPLLVSKQFKSPAVKCSLVCAKTERWSLNWGQAVNARLEDVCSMHISTLHGIACEGCLLSTRLRAGLWQLIHGVIILSYRRDKVLDCCSASVQLFAQRYNPWHWQRINAVGQGHIKVLPPIPSSPS